MKWPRIYRRVKRIGFFLSFTKSFTMSSQQDKHYFLLKLLQLFLWMLPYICCHAKRQIDISFKTQSPSLENAMRVKLKIVQNQFLFRDFYSRKAKKVIIVERLHGTSKVALAQFQQSRTYKCLWCLSYDPCVSYKLVLSASFLRHF